MGRQPYWSHVDSVYTPVRGSMQRCGEHCSWTKVGPSAAGICETGMAEATGTAQTRAVANTKPVKRMMTSMYGYHRLRNLNEG